MNKAMPVQIPQVPNFIKVGGEYVSITEFTESELRELGPRWVTALVDRAARIKDIRKTGKK